MSYNRCVCVSRATRILLLPSAEERKSVPNPTHFYVSVGFWPQTQMLHSGFVHSPDKLPCWASCIFSLGSWGFSFWAYLGRFFSLAMSDSVVPWPPLPRQSLPAGSLLPWAWAPPGSGCPGEPPSSAGLFRPFVGMTEPGPQCGCWGQGETQHSALLLQIARERAAHTCLFVQFQALVFQRKYLSGTSLASDLRNVSVDYIMCYIYNQQFMAKWRFQWNGICDEWHQPWFSFVFCSHRVGP